MVIAFKRFYVKTIIKKFIDTIGNTNSDGSYQKK